MKYCFINKRVCNNRYVLNIIINCIPFCGAFELALYGHDETESSSNPGIFQGLSDFSSEPDTAMKNHLKKTTGFKGTSKTIQNELLNMFEICDEKVMSEVREADYLTAVADETSNVAPPKHDA